MKSIWVSIPIKRLQQLCEQNTCGGSHKGCADCILMNNKDYPFNKCAYQRFRDKQKLRVIQNEPQPKTTGQ